MILTLLCVYQVLSNAVLALANLVSNYGVKKVKIAEYAEIMLKNAQNTNPDCKKYSYQYYKAVYKWIGDVILPQIEDKLKKAQMVSCSDKITKFHFNL